MKLIGLLTLLSAFAAACPALAYPVSVRSCNETVTFAKGPQRGLTGSANMVQTIVDLGLVDRFVGFAGLGNHMDQIKGPPAVLEAVRKKTFALDKARMEGILGQTPDFYFSGWLYGFNEATGVTPDNLARYGIGAYVLNESCIKHGPREPISLNSTFVDILSLGRIFNVEDRAQANVSEQKRRIAEVARKVATLKRRYRVMYCSGCRSDTAPRTTGREGFPKVIIDAAGGQNVYNELKDSYVNVSWESMIARDPEWMIIETGGRPQAEIVTYLTSRPILQSVTAIRKRNFIFVIDPEYEPSTRNGEAIERIARIMYPELFAAPIAPQRRPQP